jgi:glycosyltransferase involved in cell wall biosynthesis
MQITDVLALIPAWNEAKRIEYVINSLPEGMPVLVVDDGSTDSTVEAADAAGAIVISHKTNLGKGTALMSGFKWALERDFAAVLTLDADGQHDPEEASKFLSAYNQVQTDLIIGRRSTREMPFPRNVANLFSSWLISRALQEKIYDNQSGYRLHSRKLLEHIEIRRTGFEFEVDVILQTLQRGFTLGWVDIRTIYDASISSHFHPLRDTLKFFTVAWYAYRSRRQTQTEKRHGAH